MIADRPIIFSGPMVRALLEVRKSQDRRVIKPQPESFETSPGVLCKASLYFEEAEPRGRIVLGSDHAGVITLQRVPYAVGDRLWVREQILQSLSGCTLPCGEWQSYWTGEKVEYAADGAKERYLHPERMYSPWMKKRPSIHMPRKYSRITLLVTDVRVQRLQEISEEDAIAEGVEFNPKTGGYWGAEGKGVGGATRQYASAKLAYMDLWDSINASRGYGWETNPWVVALSFKPILAQEGK